MKLFGLAYACRIYQGEFDDVYRQMCEGLGPDPDLTRDQPDCLLEFLNKWSCRIPKAGFPVLRECLRKWAAEWIKGLPDKDIRCLSESEHQTVAQAYDALLEEGKDLHFWNTATAKTLHALRRNTLPMWDAKIRDSFINKRREFSAYSGGQIYSEFIRYVGEQISVLEQEVTGLGYSLSCVAQLVDRPNASLVKLVDEYHWITITEGHVAPKRDEIELWLHWINSPTSS